MVNDMTIQTIHQCCALCFSVILRDSEYFLTAKGATPYCIIRFSILYQSFSSPVVQRQTTWT